jgi:hypothetical protein
MGNSFPHFGHLAIAQLTVDGQPEHAKALPYVMSKVKPHLGHFTACFGCELVLFHLP